MYLENYVCYWYFLGIWELGYVFIYLQFYLKLLQRPMVSFLMFYRVLVESDALGVK